MQLRLSAILLQLFKVIMLEKRVLTTLELNCNQRLGHNKTKLNIILSSYAHVVDTTAKLVISRRRKNENVCKISKDEICTCKACKNTVFHCQICKFVGFWGFCCRRRRGCLSSLLGSLRSTTRLQRRRHKICILN